MGFFKEFFSDLDEPAFLLTWGEKETTARRPQRDSKWLETETLKRLEQENKELKRLLTSKKINSIDTDYKLLE